MVNKIEEYIDKQPSPQREICRTLRELIVDTLPGVNEEMKWGVPAFADGRFYIVALKKHVNLGFSLKGITGEDEKLFDGGGKTMKHIAVTSLADIDASRIARLLQLVNAR
jgi:hypothetical protein